MSEKKLIAVVGATGAQGGGLARAILNDREGDFAVRALTRKPDSAAALALRNAGAEVVAADLDDVDSLVRAFEGAYGAFCVTNFREHFSPERERQQAKNLAEAAGRAGVQHVVWSTLEDTREDVPLDSDRMPTLMGSHKVPHFDAKGESDRFFRIFRAGPSLAGEVIGIAGEHLTVEAMAAKMSAALGEEVVAADVTPETFRTFGFPGAEDLGNMFRYYQDFETELAAVRSVGRSRELNAELQDFDAWLARNASLMPIAPRAAPRPATTAP
jgi:hypothetical protein